MTNDEQIKKDADEIAEIVSGFLGSIDGSQLAIIANRFRRTIDDVSPQKAVAHSDAIEPMPYEEAQVFAATRITFGQYHGERVQDSRQSADARVTNQRGE